jgi:hypothetical protein
MHIGRFASWSYTYQAVKLPACYTEFNSSFLYSKGMKQYKNKRQKNKEEIKIEKKNE